MANIPTLVNYLDTDWSVTTSPKVTGTFTWNAGDVFVCIAGVAWFTNIPDLPTATGLTFTSLASNNVTNTCATNLSIATAASNGSGTISGTIGGSGNKWAFGVWQFRKSGGVGSFAEQHTATKIVSLTPSNGGTNSAIVWGIFDFQALAITGISITPTPTDSRQKVQESTNYTVYVADLNPQTSAGAISYGLSGGSGTGPFSIVAAEVMGLGGVTNNYQFVKAGDGMSVSEKIR